MGTYDLILNSYGHNKNIGSIHIGVSDHLTAIEIQRIEREITTLMYYKYNTIMTTGIYAQNLSDEESKEVYQVILDTIKEYPHIIQIHGFYLDKAKKLINYDLVISFDEKQPEELIEEVKMRNQKDLLGYEIFINYDQDFTLS